MNRTPYAALAALLIAVPAIATCPAWAQTLPTPEIVVSGTGQVSVKPDIVYVSLGVVTRGKAASTISQTNAVRTDAVIKALRASGVASDDIATEEFEFDTDYSYANNKTVFKGYVVSNIVRVTVRDIAKVGKVLDASLRGGANKVTGITFGLANPQKAQNAALQKAIADATAQAKIAAKAAGITSIELKQLVVGGNNVSEYQLAAYESSRPLSLGYTPIRAGQRTVIVTVTARFVATDKAPTITP